MDAQAPLFARSASEALRFGGASISVTGRCSAKTLPCRPRFVFETPPPCSLANRRAIDNPKPACPASGTSVAGR